MQIYADTSNVEEIQKLWDGGLIQGITTNPSIIAKEYGTTNNWHNIIKDISAGAVFFSVVFGLIVALMIYYPKIS